MRPLYAFLLLLLLSCPLVGRAQQPFERFGVKIKMLTLSNGRYPEFFTNDSLRRIGSVIYNTRLRRIAYLLPPDSLVGRVKPEVTSRWFSPDPLAEKYLFISPYVFVANNPIRYMDPDGRQIVGTDGKPVTYTRNEETGKVTFSDNASKSAQRIGNALLTTGVGTEQLDKLISSDVKVTLRVSQEEKTGSNGLPQRGGTVLDKVSKQADGTYKAEAATVTVYEKSVNKTADAKGYEREGVFAGTAGHEIDHATNQENVNMQQQNSNNRAKNDVESGPNVIRDAIINQFEDKKAGQR